MSKPETLSPLEKIRAQSGTWFGDAKQALQDAATNRAEIGHLTTIDIATTAPEDRHFPKGTLDPSDVRFIEGLEGSIWNEHVQGELARLEEARRAAIDEGREDPILAQYAELKQRLDHPNINQPSN